MIFHIKKIQANRMRLLGRLLQEYWRKPETQFGDLRGFYSVDEKVPAEEIKIDCTALCALKPPV